MKKILFVNAPFRSYCGEFVNIEKYILKRKLFKTLECITGFSNMHTLAKLLKLNLLDNTGFRYGVRAGSRWPWTTPIPHGDSPYPFMMGYSASLLKSKGFNVDIIDAVVSETYSIGKFLKEVKSQKADIVVIECAEITQNFDLWCAKHISAKSEVALAGPHFTDEIISKLQKEAPFVKYFLKGEYIKSSLKMAQTREKGVYESEIVTDLDSIPFPYREHKCAEKYFEVTMPTPKPQLQIYSSKGCPFKCKFCMWPQTMYKGTVAQRSPKKVAEEIKLNVKKHGYKSIFFDDDTFNIGTERVSELCDYLKEIGLPWTMMGRLDCSPNWLYDKMIDSGCVGMRFGLETFNINVLKRISKGLERFDFQSTLKYISEKYPDIWIHLTMMKDLPGQTEEMHQNDMKILRDLGFECGIENIKRSFQLSSCVPFKGTKLYEELVEKLGEEYMEKNNKFDGAQSTLMSKLNQEGYWKDKDV